ncbi:hypothetical protein [Methylorubrum extorquens]|uniref:Uncharacterized protein n=1 Tax=Methylorubrum extorquens DSM 13060 TaxID=882800 RepID=H1KBZ4_METEX|nr:hypothetical protein [Methylorubrum extorquens]EHP94991.1 hypothetical protein MetexDRAFT_0156 [Methylorubrum extorquens DSM 13060]
MRNPLRNIVRRSADKPNRPTLKQRAVALKATAARVIRRRAVEVAPATPSADPRLMAMVTEMLEARRKLNDPAVPDGPEADALGERETSLCIGIHRFPAQSIHDMRAKLPLLREEAEDAARGWDSRRVPFKESLPGAAWAGLLRDIEHLAGAPAVVPAGADARLLEAEAAFSADDAALDEQWERMDAAEDAYAPPPMPAALKVWGNDWMYPSIPQPGTLRRAGGSETYGKEEVEILRTRPCMRRAYGVSEGERQPDGSRVGPDKMAQARADAIVAAWDEWQAGLRAAREAVDLPRLEAEREALFSRRNAALALIRDTPAKTLAGLAVKARTARDMEAGIDLRQTACQRDDDDAEGFFYTLAADVLDMAAPLAVGPQPEAATASLADQILTAWREYGTDIGVGDEEESEATRALSERRSALIDAAEALPATRENVPAKALALAWLEYVDSWQNGQARDAYSIDGRLALDIDTAICGRLLTEF